MEIPIILIIVTCLLSFGGGYARGRMDGFDAGIKAVRSAMTEPLSNERPLQAGLYRVEYVEADMVHLTTPPE